jgi:hypothetical protein
MDEQLEEWQALYRQQEVDLTQIAVELMRVRNRDRLRYAVEGAAATVVLTAACAYLYIGGLVMTVTGIGLLLFLAYSAYGFSRLARVDQAEFAAPSDYLTEIEVRNRREIRRLEPLSVIFFVVALCFVVNSLALWSAWEAYVASPWVFPSAVLVEAAILAGVLVWRNRELGRLYAEREQIALLGG